ncbi:hypothetical protein QSJ18_08835 [Gordonia sp. ABSL1-1]|uniref:hypothetical protein n=1 Tax=Gordonia sp. ABSL1-1 TaxID=3053923 RepID=UPI002573CF8C|nr:hypothetical protein [Gordonia sp. ABSL1-1]MDL9936842.1 hypothetical protein [Gordonia sp. ABSL1-1]
MPIRSSAAEFRRRLPFGIGTVVGMLSVVLVVIVGAVLAIDRPAGNADHGFGQLRSYRAAPEDAWTLTDADLPGYLDTGGPIRVEEADDDIWLISYPIGLGRAFTTISRSTGRPLWQRPLDVGLGDCAFTTSGRLGCAVRLANPADGGLDEGFYLIDDAGNVTESAPRNDTARVAGVGSNFLRINDTGFRVTLSTPAGRTLWSRSFAAAVAADVNGTGGVEVTDHAVIVATVDGSYYLINRTDGTDTLACTSCTMRTYPTGLAVEYHQADARRVEIYPISTAGRIAGTPSTTIANAHLLRGSSVRPALTADNAVLADHGTYVVIDPRSGDSWKVDDPEASKAGARPCGTLLSVPRIDRSRVTLDLVDGSRIGEAPVPAHHEANIDNYGCVGSSGSTLIGSNGSRIAAFAADGGVVWQQNLGGSISVVDGFLVAARGTTLSVLRPN